MGHGCFCRGFGQPWLLPNPLQFRGCCSCARETPECLRSQLGSGSASITIPRARSGERESSPKKSHQTTGHVEISAAAGFKTDDGCPTTSFQALCSRTT